MTGFPKLQNRLRGRTAKAAGTAFEELFERVARLQRIGISRIHDGCRRVGPRPTDLIRMKQPFDWVLSYRGLSALIDTKSVAGKALPCSAIDPNQRRELARHASHGGIAGYVVWTRDTKDFYFIPASVLEEKAKLKRGSISASDTGVVRLGVEPHPNLTAIFTAHVERLLSQSDDMDEAHALLKEIRKGFH